MVSLRSRDMTVLSEDNKWDYPRGACVRSDLFSVNLSWLGFLTFCFKSCHTNPINIHLTFIRKTVKCRKEI